MPAADAPTPLSHSTVVHWSKKKDQDKRLRIMWEAEKLFARDGFQKTDLTRVAENAAVGKSTIYKYFPTKDDLLRTVVRENFHYMATLALSQLIGEGDPAQRLSRTCFTVADFLDQNKAFCTVLIKESGQLMEEIQTIYSAILFDNVQLAEAFFAHFKTNKLLPPIETQGLLKIIIDLTIGLLYTWVLSGNYTLRSQVDFYLDLFKLNPEKA
ncbi:MAG TPA: TetR/AcrR family transcriptional regulator [Pseudomonadales bacterium]|nr:TetR/AcrR family transcriptional regulator [Pseudomonadales bacterium]